MLREALWAPVADSDARDALVACTVLTLAALLCLRYAVVLWPGLLAPVLVVLAVSVTIPLAGYVGTVLATPVAPGDGALPPFPPALVSRRGLAVLTVAAAYLVVPAGVLVGTAFVLLGAGGSRLEGPLLAVAPTVSLLGLLVAGYLLPGGLAATVEGGVRTGLSRSAVGGLGHPGYFVAWTAAAVAVATGWGALGAAGTGPSGVLAAVGLVYTHLVAARLVAAGLSRADRTQNG
jgi:hypothetical protein